MQVFAEFIAGVVAGDESIFGIDSISQPLFL
jgi:hypothetical protein